MEVEIVNWFVKNLNQSRQDQRISVKDLYVNEKIFEKDSYVEEDVAQGKAGHQASLLAESLASDRNSQKRTYKILNKKRTLK